MSSKLVAEGLFDMQIKKHEEIKKKNTATFYFLRTLRQMQEESQNGVSSFPFF